MQFEEAKLKAETEAKERVLQAEKEKIMFEKEKIKSKLQAQE